MFAVRTRWWWRRNVHAGHEAQQKSCAATRSPFTSRTPRSWTRSTTSLLSSPPQASTRHSHSPWATTRPTTATGTPPCCHRKATASTTRLSAQPTGCVCFSDVLLLSTQLRAGAQCSFKALRLCIGCFVLYLTQLLHYSSESPRLLLTVSSPADVVYSEHTTSLLFLIYGTLYTFATQSPRQILSNLAS